MTSDAPTAQPLADRVRERLAQVGPARVVASDLDGTLLRSDGTVSPRTRAAWAAAEEAGLVTVLVTARPPRWLDDVEAVVGPHGIAVCANGAFVYDVPARRVVAETGFDAAALAEVVADLRRELPGIAFAAERRSGFHVEDGYASDHPLPADAVRGPVGAQGAPRATEGGVVGKLLARHDAMPDEEFRAAVARVVGERGALHFSGARGLAEISAPGVSKAAGLAAWCAERDLPAAFVWSFGDMPGDLPMLTWAGTGVAVGNGHPDVVAAADLVTEANDDDGVALVVEHLLG